MFRGLFHQLRQELKSRGEGKRRNLEVRNLEEGVDSHHLYPAHQQCLRSRGVMRKKGLGGIKKSQAKIF